MLEEIKTMKNSMAIKEIAFIIKHLLTDNLWTQMTSLETLSNSYRGNSTNLTQIISEIRGDRRIFPNSL